jgi:hypothetical protein
MKHHQNKEAGSGCELVGIKTLPIHNTEKINADTEKNRLKNIADLCSVPQTPETRR